MTSILTLDDLHKNFGERAAVDGLRLEMGPGQIHGLIGRNGAGKTTTIRMVMGIFFPDRGAISLFGRPWSADALDRVGYLPEERGMYRKMKLLEHLRFFCTLKGKSGGAVEKKLREYLERFDLWARRDETVESLSKGNQQKAQLAGVLAFDPDLIILDEPMSGLDPVNVILVRNLLEELKAAGKTLLLSTHMMDEAERLCDTITLIHQGKAVLSGPLTKLKKEFGSARIEIQYNGDGAFLKQLPGVLEAKFDDDRAVLSLLDHQPPETIFKAAFEKLDVQRFEYGYASLEEIFIKTVGTELAGEGN
jgi:ABC-2 type transport system ATP-binding protein